MDIYVSFKNLPRTLRRTYICVIKVSLKNREFQKEIRIVVFKSVQMRWISFHHSESDTLAVALKVL